jgi:hypothetical protein
MKRIILFAALAFFSLAAMAGTCPKLWKEIDAALPAAKLSAAQMADVTKLRADGEALHKAGKHSDSESSLKKAKGILGLK